MVTVRHMAVWSTLVGLIQPFDRTTGLSIFLPLRHRPRHPDGDPLLIRKE